MHESTFNFVKQKVMQRGIADKNTLEVGSLDVNGSVRELFTGNYIGVDMREGKGVDRVMNAHSLDGAWNERFDVVVSTEMLEHDDMFWLSMSEMGRVLKKGGYLIITARGNGFNEHGYPYDYWRFNISAFNVLIGLAGCKPLEVIDDPMFPGVFGIGVKE
jgi:SAM-dependent methyltransferase